MICRLDDARAVQQRRFNAGLFGVAKAVRRFLLRGYPKRNDYRDLVGSLAVRWKKAA